MKLFSFKDDLIVLHSDMLFYLKPKRADVGLAMLRHLPRLSNLVKQKNCFSNIRSKLKNEQNLMLTLYWIRFRI